MPTFIEQVGKNAAITVPAAAATMNVGGLLTGRFAAEQADGETRRRKPTRNADGHYTFPVSLLARSPNAIQHWYWGKIVHDLAGVQTAGALTSIDWLHDSDRLCGSGKLRLDADGLYLDGEIVSFREGDDGDQICNYLIAGIPLEASIQFDVDSMKWSFLETNQIAHVNGRQVEGECLLIHQWMLRRVAVCPSGRDPHTKTHALSHDADDRYVLPPPTPSLLSEDAMSLQAKPTAPAAPAPSAAPSPAPSPVQAAPVPAAPAASPAPAAFSTEQLTRYIDRFGGERAALWIKEGLGYEAALDRFAAKLETDLVDARAALAQRDETIKAMQVGHAAPANFTPAEQPVAKAPLPQDGHAKFAADLAAQIAALK
jgi:hypothetical protein